MRVRKKLGEKEWNFCNIPDRVHNCLQQTAKGKQTARNVDLAVASVSEILREDSKS